MMNGNKSEDMNRRMVYVAGPISGMPDGNYNAFVRARRNLERQGWRVVIPHDFADAFRCDSCAEPPPRMLEMIMDAELAALPHFHAICLIAGWERSKGARRELAVALQHGLMVIGANPAMEGGAE